MTDSEAIRQSRIKDLKIKIRDVEIELKNSQIAILESENVAFSKMLSDLKSKYALSPEMRYSKHD